MRHEKPGLKEQVIQIIKNSYNISPEEMIFIPIGEESMSYRVKDGNTEFFVKIRLDVEKYSSISQINNLLVELQHFSFIVPPIQTNDGKRELRSQDGILYVFPFIKGEISMVPNPEFPKELVENLTDIMIQFHNATHSIQTVVPREEFSPTYHSWFEKLILQALDRPEALFAQMLNANKSKIQKILDDHVENGFEYKKKALPFVLTHGDITMANFITTTDDLKLIDWDESMIGPKEADLMFFIDNPHFDTEKYLHGVGQEEIDKGLSQYYKDRWAITSILNDLQSLANPDLGEADVKEKVRDAEEYLGYY